MIESLDDGTLLNRPQVSVHLCEEQVYRCHLQQYLGVAALRLKIQNGFRRDDCACLVADLQALEDEAFDTDMCIKTQNQDRSGACDNLEVYEQTTFLLS